MLRQWKHIPDIIDRWESMRRGVIPIPTDNLTNASAEDAGDNCEIVQHDINWPTHMDPDFDKFKPGQFKVEDGIPVPPKQRNMNYQWEAQLLSLNVGQCLTIRLDGTLKEASNLMIQIRNRLKKINPELCKTYVSRSIKGEGKWKDIVVAVRIWKINPGDDQ